MRKWSTIQVAGRTYTVPSRLIGKEVQIRLYLYWVEVYYKDHLVERMERVRGEREAPFPYSDAPAGCWSTISASATPGSR